MSETLLTDDGVTEFAAANIALRSRKESAAAAHLLASQALASLAKSVLLGSKIYTLRKLQVEQVEGVVVLRGRVESFYHKQLAQELIRTAIDGVEVINAIHVVYTRERSLTESDCFLP